jgi:hypothetical protein
MPPQMPCELTQEQASFIREAARRIFGEDAVVRNYGTDPNALAIHVETSGVQRAVSGFIGILMTRLDHIPAVSITERGTKAQGNAKVAYRQGKLL